MIGMCEEQSSIACWSEIVNAMALQLLLDMIEIGNVIEIGLGMVTVTYIFF